MEYERMENGYRVFLLPEEIKNILDSAKSGYERRIRVMIMLMCCSLRIGTAVEIKAGDFFKQDGLWWLEVEGKDPTDGYQGTKSRKVWIPAPVKSKIDTYIEDNGLSDDNYLADIGERQLSNNIKTTTENAAIATENDDYKKVTAHDFRRYFATHLIMRLDQDEEMVRQLGGWKEISHMWEYLLLPTDLVKRRLGEGGLLGSNPIFMEGRGDIELIKESFDTIDLLAEETDDEDVMGELKSRIKKLGKKVDGIHVSITDVDTNSEDFNGEVQHHQSAATAFNDNEHVYGPIVALLIGYFITIGTVINWIMTQAYSMWNQYVGISIGAWLRAGAIRSGCVLLLFMMLSISALAVSMAQVGVYIDLSTWTIETSRNGALTLLIGMAINAKISGYIEEEIFTH